MTRWERIARELAQRLGLTEAQLQSAAPKIQRAPAAPRRAPVHAQRRPARTIEGVRWPAESVCGKARHDTPNDQLSEDASAVTCRLCLKFTSGPNERQRAVLEARESGQTFAEIGRRLGVSAGRARQIHERAGWAAAKGGSR